VLQLVVVLLLLLRLLLVLLVLVLLLMMPHQVVPRWLWCRHFLASCSSLRRWR
jgi:hypothetical protein